MNPGGDDLLCDRPSIRRLSAQGPTENGAVRNCCCPPGRSDFHTVVAPARNESKVQAATCSSGMRLLEGGTFLMGSDDSTFPQDGEAPVREVFLEPFFIDPFAVTNNQFDEFVAATEYVTEAEKFGWSFVFYQFLPSDFQTTRAVVGSQWWRQVFGSDWRHPDGPHSDIRDRSRHPVVHVSWTDAVAFAAWARKRLPSEAEWEYAARGGLVQNIYPWGNDLVPNGEHRCNIWQGTFPTNDTGADGYCGTAPVDSFPPNGFGLYNMVGNTWEWCSDWFDAQYLSHDSRTDDTTASRDKVIRGGSYLCHESYCNRYRVSARYFNSPSSSTGHMGFRLALDASTDRHHGT